MKKSNKTKKKYNFYEETPDGVNYNDYYKQMDEHMEAEMAKSKKLPKGLQVGKIFTVPHADGYAFYEITKIFRTKVHIVSRLDLCPDRWQAYILGAGGSFDRHIIEGIVIPAEQFEEILAKNRKSQNRL